MFDLAVKQRGLAVEKFVDLIASNPAERFNLPNKGEIAVSKDADIILVDPNQSYVVKREDLYYKNKHSAYEGRKIDCRVTKTIVRGNVVFDLRKRNRWRTNWKINICLLKWTIQSLPVVKTGNGKGKYIIWRNER